MVERERMRQEAYQEYMKERGQVDLTVEKMINEDLEAMRINKMKQE